MIVVKHGDSDLERTVGWPSSCGTADTVLNDTLLEVPHLLPCTLHAFTAYSLVHCHLPSYPYDVIIGICSLNSKL